MTAKEKLSQAWDTLRFTDRRRLEKRYLKTLDMIERGINEEDAPFIRLFLADLEKASKESLCRFTKNLYIEYPEKLPITSMLDELKQAVSSNQVVIVCGATGSGKTTQLPKIAIDCGCAKHGIIGCTQPRRLAATALAARFADECRVTPGCEAGYQIRFDNRTSDATVVKFMTDGILLAETRHDPDLLKYGCIVLDEVHERSLNIDFLLGYMKQLLERRSDLKLIISSATVESKRISEFFNNACVVEIPGGLYPIEDISMPLEEDEELCEGVYRASVFLTELDPRGDILVFLPGEREIRECSEYLAGKRFNNTDVLPLFGRLSASEQSKVFQKSSRRRIVLATNVAETSVTIPGIRFVIDSGLVRLNRFNPRSRVQELLVERVSKASAKQRRGRCGRLSDGVCVRLYSESDLESSPEYTAPEIQRTALSGVILQMAALRLPPIEQFPLLDPPSGALIREGVRTLADLHAVTSENPGERQLTRDGVRLAALPVDPHIGRMLLAAVKYNCLSEMCVTAAYLSVTDPKERPFDKTKEADAAHKRFDSEESDFLGILKLYYAAFCQGFSNSRLRSFCKQNYLNYRKMREWLNLASELAEHFNCQLPEDAAETVKNGVSLHRAAVCGIPRQIACFDRNERVYRDMTGRSFTIFPGSGLARFKKTPPYIVYFTVMETRMRYARICAAVDVSYLLEAAPHLCRALYDNIRYDSNSGFVYARERINCGSLVVVPGRNVHYSKVDMAEARRIFIADGLVRGAVPRNCAPWVRRLCDDLELLRQLEVKMRRLDCIVDEDALFRMIDKVLPENISSVSDIKQHYSANRKAYVFDAAEFVCFDDVFELLEKYPDSLESGPVSCRLEYRFDPGSRDDGITMFISEESVPLFDRHKVDYLVPGLLDRKVEIMLKSLPKAVRREISPIQQAVEKFCLSVSGLAHVVSESLADSLIAFLEREYELELSASAFDDVEYPAFLVMKVAITDKDGKVKSVTQGFPEQSRTGSRLSCGISRKMGVDGGVWGADDLERVVEIPGAQGRLGYPALCVDEKNVSAAVFLNSSEALHSHRKAVINLVRNSLKDECAYWMKKCRFSNQVKLTLFLGSGDPAGALLDAAILEALPVSPEDIRSSAAFETALETAKPEIGSVMSRFISVLEEQCSAVDRLKKSACSLPEHSFCRQDVLRQLKFLYRPGFLETAESFREYPRYLRSLALRLERAGGGGCAKDEQKAEKISPHLDRFYLASENRNIAENPGLREFFLLLEEARIAAFTPELQVKVKSAVSKLETLWRTVKLT